MAEFDAEIVRFALETARQKGFGEVELETEGIKFSAKLEARRTLPPAGGPPQPQAETIEESGPQNMDILSPCVGYYQSGTPALEVGRSIQHGEIVASIQALGIANDVESAAAGEVVEVLAKDGDAVEFGQPLARLLVKT